MTLQLMIIDEFAFENHENGWLRTPNIERNLENYNSVLSLEREKVTFFDDKPTYRELKFGISKIDTFFKLGFDKIEEIAPYMYILPRIRIFGKDW